MYNQEYYFPLQVIFAIKEKNGGKLHSHLWFFMGFVSQLNPKYTVLLDVGTVPHRNALTQMYIGCEEDPQIGGACGEIAVRNMRPWNYLDSIQAFEYITNHCLDKYVCAFLYVYNTAGTLEYTSDMHMLYMSTSCMHVAKIANITRDNHLRVPLSLPYNSGPPSPFSASFPFFPAPSRCTVGPLSAAIPWPRTSRSRKRPCATSLRV